MGAARIREGAFGRAQVRLMGAEILFLDEAEPAIDTQVLADRPPVDILGAFEVAAVDADEPDRQAAILVEVQGDPRVILALVWREHGLAAVTSNSDRDGVVFFAFEHVTAGTLIRIVECDSEADAATWS